MTDYHNNDGAQWMAAHWKTCFIIRMKLPPLYVAVTPKQASFSVVAELAELMETSQSHMQISDIALYLKL